MVGKDNSKTTKSTKPKTTSTKSTVKSTKTTKQTKAAKSTDTTKTKPVSKLRKVIMMIACIALPLAVGGLSTIITGGAMQKFDQFNKPPLSPPGWLFPVAWTILYVLMGIASYFIIMKPVRTKQEKFERKVAVTLYLTQLAFNFVWSPIFFLAGDFFFALFWLIAMWIIVIILMFWTRKRSMAAVWLLLPYVLWCLFATYLNAGIMLLN